MSYKTSITLQSLLEELAKDRDLARRIDQPGAAIQATVVQAKLIGLMVERKEAGAPGDFANLTAEQAIEQVRKDHGDAQAEALAKLLATPDEQPAPIEPDIPPPTSSTLN